jgi:phytoene dehydrogenase-like protein
MPMTNYDALIIGGGHNGLICAAYLAKTGKKVAVLEAKDTLGGCASTHEIIPGFKVSGCAQWLHQLSPDITKDLQLDLHGLKYAARNLPTIALGEAGSHITLDGDGVEGSGISAEDQIAYKRFHGKMLKYAKLLRTAYEQRPPKLVESNWADRLTLLKLGLGMKRMGRDDMSDFMRLILINIYDLMKESFDNPLLQGAISLDAVLGTALGPRSPNTVFSYLHRQIGEVYGYRGVSQVAGGMGKVGQVLASSARKEGVDIRISARVTRINLEGSRVGGVTLESGEKLFAPLVISNADPVTTFASLLGFENMEAGMARRVSQIRNNSGTAKLHLALKGLPRFTGVSDAELGNRLLIAPDMNYLERAFNPIKYRQYSPAPALDISIASINDPDLCKPGNHVLSALVQYAPYAPDGGWEEHKQTFTNIVIDRINQYAPGIKDQIVASELCTPADLEKDYGMTGGQWHHGELSIDQVLMMRPFPGCSQYASAVDGLYLCGAGAHPGGGVMGLAGKNAAAEVIKRGNQA